MVLAHRRAHVISADGAHRAAHTAPDGDLLDDARLDLFDQLAVSVRAQDIRPRSQSVQRVAHSRSLTLHALRFTGDDTRLLVVGGRIMVEDARLADEELLHLSESLQRKALIVAVDVIVTQRDREKVDLLRAQLSACVAVHERHLILCAVKRGVLQYDSVLHAFTSKLCSICAALALSRRAAASSVSSCRLILLHSTRTRGSRPTDLR